MNLGILIGLSIMIILLGNPFFEIQTIMWKIFFLYLGVHFFILFPLYYRSPTFKTFIINSINKFFPPIQTQTSKSENNFDLLMQKIHRCHYFIRSYEEVPDLPKEVIYKGLFPIYNFRTF